MEFTDFIHKLGTVLRGANNTSAFTKTIFEAILSEDNISLIAGYKPSSFKSYYNGQSSISNIAKIISASADPLLFSDYIHSFPDSAVDSLCKLFKDEIPDINLHNAGDRLAELFISIINDAAGAQKRGASSHVTMHNDIPPIIISPSAIAPDLATVKDGVLYMQPIIDDNAEEPHPLQAYIDTASLFYSTKKTLLYAEQPHPFYDLYVCNDIRYKKYKASGDREPNADMTMQNASIQKLEAESEYIIIEGLGGIGKSMLLTHLFLSSANDSKRIPLLLFLKDYKDDISSIVDFIWRSVKDFDPEIKHSDIINCLQNKELVLLLDGLDEIQSSIRDSFHTDLEAFIKSYPGNMVVITSRPVNNFVAYSKFTIFDIEPLTKPQALELITKLDFWDEPAKASFMEDLDKNLYSSHFQFASNPLLLTIMLMTYSSFGEVPAKMHVFYSKAYETMARLHDATKGSYKRPLYTNLSPEEFAKLFAEFCARTYRDEEIEFTEMTFGSYMSKVLEGSLAEYRGVTPHDFLLDLTDNLCIMYREGEKYYFIHRSFQEYFAAVHFATGYDSKLTRVGKFFERMQHRSYTDRTFDMLYDMIPEKIERYIFLPYLQELFKKCSAPTQAEEYWNYLEEIYPFLYYQEGKNYDTVFNEAKSFIYKSIIQSKGLYSYTDFDDLPWPNQLYDLPTQTSVNAYTYFLDSDVYSDILNADMISESMLKKTEIAFKDDLPYQYESLLGTPEQTGKTIEIEIYNLRHNSSRFNQITKFMEQDDFPLYEEYKDIKQYFEELTESIKKEEESDDLFDD